MKRYLPLGILLLLLTIALGLLLHEVARGQIREALRQTYEVVHSAASQVPQVVYWGLLLCLVLLIALRSIAGDPPARRRPAPLPSGGRAAEWRRWLERAAEPSSRRPFYRWLVARHLARLAIEALAYQQGIRAGEAEAHIAEGSVDMPAAVRAYLLGGFRLRPSAHGRGCPAWRPSSRPTRSISTRSKRCIISKNKWRSLMTIDVNQVAARGGRILSEVERAIVGKREVLEKILAAILAGGHILLEDYPGLAKTLIAKSFATALGLDFKRIQFTPDLLPGDITGGYVFDRVQNRFELRKGPVFANIILADEINRASPKTQAALLEAMQEYQVTLEGETMALPEPFTVVATQNPIEYEGTFPLPEAQLDRFLVKLAIGYPSPEEEQEILKRRQARGKDEVTLDRVTHGGELLEMRQTIETVYVHPDIEQYMIRLVTETRRERRVAVGASPRGSLALLKLTRAWAALENRDYVLPDDVKTFAEPALVHRLILKPDFWMVQQAAEDVIDTLVRTIPVPVIEDRA